MLRAAIIRPPSLARGLGPALGRRRAGLCAAASARVQDLHDTILTRFAEHQPPKAFLLRKLARAAESKEDSELLLAAHRRFVLAQAQMRWVNARLLLEAFGRARNWETLLDTVADSQRHQLFFDEPRSVGAIEPLLVAMHEDGEWGALRRLHGLLPAMGVPASEHRAELDLKVAEWLAAVPEDDAAAEGDDGPAADESK
jgi:hypothetical protein